MAEEQGQQQNPQVQARKTIKLKPLTKKVPSAAAPQASVPVSPSSTSPVAPAPAVTPSSPTAISPMPSPELGDTIAMTSPEAMQMEEATQKLNRPNIPPSGVLPGAKQTIKLRPTPATMPEAKPDSSPSRATGPNMTIKLKPKKAETPVAEEVKSEEEKTVAIAKQTIKLVAKKEGTGMTATKPSDPTVKLVAKQVKPSDPTVNLEASVPAGPAPVKLTPASPTIRLSPTSAPPPPAPEPETMPVPRETTDTSELSEAAEAGGMAGTKSKLTIKKPTESLASIKEGEFAPPSPEEAAADAAMAAEGAPKTEPSIIFSIAAILTLAAMSFTVYMLSMQYYNQWLKGGGAVIASSSVPADAPAKSEKKAAPAKAEDKKPDDKKADAKKAEAPAKADDKKAAAPAKPDDKKADAKAPAKAEDKKPDDKKAKK